LPKNRSKICTYYYELHGHRRTERHTALMDVNDFVSVLSILIFRFGRKYLKVVLSKMCEYRENWIIESCSFPGNLHVHRETVNTCTNTEHLDVLCEIRHGLHHPSSCNVKITAVKIHVTASTINTSVLKYRMADTVVSRYV